jgi:hypothetical protein
MCNGFICLGTAMGTSAVATAVTIATTVPIANSTIDLKVLAIMLQLPLLLTHMQWLQLLLYLQLLRGNCSGYSSYGCR